MLKVGSWRGALLLLLLLPGLTSNQLQASGAAAQAASGNSPSASRARGLAPRATGSPSTAGSSSSGSSGSSKERLSASSGSVRVSSSRPKSSSGGGSGSSGGGSGGGSSGSTASGLNSAPATAASASSTGSSVGSSSSSAGASDSIGGGASSRLCADTAFLIGGRRIRSFTDLSRLFAHYTPLPKFGGRHIVAVDVATPRPCGPFLKNATFYMRVGVRDMKIFKQVFQAQVLRVARSLFKGSGEPRRILDLGARTGMSTAYLALHFPDAQIIATEPSLPEFALLRLNTARYRNVRTEYGAVWDSLATLKLGRTLGSGRHPGASSGQPSVAQPALWKRFVLDVMEVAGGGRLGDMVPAITIPDLLQRHGWSEVDLLVADFDGADKVVLGDAGAQAWLKSVKCVSLRLTPDQSPAAILKLLGSDFARAGKVLDQYFWCRAKVLSG